MHARVLPKTNISKAYYRHVVNDIEYDPLVRHSTLSVACLIAAMCVLSGALLWFAKSNPGNLAQTDATVRSISTGKTDGIGTSSTFITFDFRTSDNTEKQVRQQVNDGLAYNVGQQIKIGYHPRNPSFARNLHDNKPGVASIVLWSVPFVLMIWLTFLALFRHHSRQVEIWAAAEAANSDD